MSQAGSSKVVKKMKIGKRVRIRLRGEEEKVGAQHSGDGAAGADHGDGGAGTAHDLGYGRRDAAEQIKDDKAETTEAVFDVVPEHPEKKHVGADVEPVAVQEHGGEDGRPGKNRVLYQIDRHQGEMAGNTADELLDLDGPVPGIHPHQHIVTRKGDPG